MLMLQAVAGVTEYEPEGKAADEVRALWQWVLRQMEKRS